MNKSEKERIEADATTRAILAHWDQINPDDRIAHLVRDLDGADSPYGDHQDG